MILAIGTLLAGAAAVFVFLRGRGTPDEAPDARNMPVLGAPADAAAADAVPAHVPASIDAAVPIDASVPIDAAVDAAISIDAPAPRSDAPRPPRNGSGSAVEAKRTGEGTLIVGANPWGDILVDGVKRGRTPTTLVVPAGKHTIDIVFGGEDPPRSKRFTIDVRPGESQQLDADFTKP